MGEIRLSHGIIEALATKKVRPENVEPILQVSVIRRIPAQKEGAVDRFRLLISDGNYSQQAMLSTDFNHLVLSGSLKLGSVVKLTEFTCNYIQDKQLIMMLNIDIVHEDCDIIGDPKPWPHLCVPDDNVPPLTGGEVANPPATGNLVRPSYGVATSAPRPSIGGNNYAGSPSKESGPRPNISGTHYGGSPLANSAPGPNIGGNNYAGSPSMESVPRPNISGTHYGGSPMLNSAPRTNIGGNPYGGSAVPTYQKTEYGSGVSQAPANNYINLPPPSSHNQRPASSYNQPTPSLHNQQHASSYNQRQTMFANRRPEARNEAAPKTIPIHALNPYQGRWSVKARVTVKTELRTYSNNNRNGQVFSFDLLDSEGGEIRVTCFNDVAGRFYNVIEQGGVYTISKGMVKPANKKFNHLGNQYEIHLDATSTVETCVNDDKTIPELQWHFRKISDIELIDSGSVLDLIGVVTSVDQTRSITRKDNSATLRRTLQMKDMSGKSVEITLWGNFCDVEGSELENLCVSENSPVLALKSGRVNDFNGKSIGTMASSQLFINPKFCETQTLKEWFSREGKFTTAVSLSKELNLNVRKVVISQIKDENLGTSDKPDWITVSATLIFIKVDNFCYPACPLKFDGRQCNKKVTDEGDGKYRCERCDQTVDKCDYRYILQMQIQDHTGLTWVTAFQESGIEVIGISAEKLFNLKHVERDDEKFNELIRNILFTKFNFKLKVKAEVFSDEERVKSSVVKAEKLNFQTETKFLFDSSAKLEQGDSGSLPQPKSENMISDPTGGFSTGNRDTPTHALNYSGTASNVTRDCPAYTSQVSPYGKNQNTHSNFVSTGSASYCTSCGGTGHSPDNCPSLISTPRQSYGSGFGNNASPGPIVGNIPPAYGSGNMGPRFGNNASHVPSVESVKGNCYKCHQNGHWANNCPANIPPAHGGGNVGSGRYGMMPNQQAGL